MGIYTSTGFSGSSIDIYSPAEEELCCEGFDVNFYEASMVAVAESEAIYNNSMKEVGIAELRYFEENGQEVIYEAVDVKAIFNKMTAKMNPSPESKKAPVRFTSFTSIN